MSLESLANELLLDIFRYLNTVDLVHSFHRLNHYFDQLLSLHFQIYPFDLRSISKKNFDSLCLHHLPFLTDQLTSIHLSNEEETPNQPQLFLSSVFHFHRFLHLQSLSLYHIHSIQLINEILTNTPLLIYLNLRTCHFDGDHQQTEICFNQIWSLTRLQICHLNEIFSSTATTISSSIQQLSLQNSSLSFDALAWLFQHTSALQILQIQIEDFSDGFLFNSIFTSLNRLTMDFRGTLENLQMLLRNLPNLSNLTLTISRIYINGYQWEDFIRHSLKKLLIFRLLMFYQFDELINIHQELEELQQSFQTQFWFDEHQWFIQYHCHTESRRIQLYTLPYAFPRFFYIPSDISQSTCSMQRKYQSFKSVRNLIFDDGLTRLGFQFPNIHHLELTLPFIQNMSSVMPRLNHLTSMEIVSITHSDEFDQSILRLRHFLDQAIHLYSLTIDYLILSALSTIRTENSSIRRMDLMLNDGHFYGVECISLIQSFLGDQCEVLLINFEHRSIILRVIEQMPKLRALICQCQDDQWGENTNSLSIDDELMQWLIDHLPRNSSINRDDQETSALRIWLGSSFVL